MASFNALKNSTLLAHCLHFLEEEMVVEGEIK